MSDTVTAATAAPAPAFAITIAGKTLSSAGIVDHLGTNWQTSLIGVAMLGLGVLSSYGVPLPFLGALHLTQEELIMGGLGALGFLVAKDGHAK